jgi:hemerythrin-like domain-containing protein
MSHTPKPIKRSEQLAPLSREHHEGLLFAWKIKQGLKNGTAIKTISQFVQWFWQNDLQEHFRKEEQVLANCLPAGDALVTRMTDEHQNIEALIHINGNIADEALLAQLADAVNDHIRFEERELFPHAEKILTTEQLNFIHTELSAERPSYPKWEDEFWVNK